MNINLNKIDISSAVDLSLPFDAHLAKERAWYIGSAEREAVVLGDWKGSIDLGGSVNFFNWKFNPHAHGTHTESLSHVVGGELVVPKIDKLFYHSLLFTAPACGVNEALDLTAAIKILERSNYEALIIRTLPNNFSKEKKCYSNQNPAFISPDDAAKLAQLGIIHLLIDLPSVDPEEDGGALAAHKAFWGLPQNPRYEAYITELIYVPDDCADGTFALQIQTAPFVNDALPSRPMIYSYL